MMRKGTIKQFNLNSAYGFIEGDLTHSSYFVFYKSIKEEGYKRLNIGQRAHHQLARGKKGLRCISVYVDRGQKEKLSKSKRN